MGFKDKLKKKKVLDKEKPEEIGGLLENAVIPERLSDAPSREDIPGELTELHIPSDPEFSHIPDDDDEETDQKDEELSALDIFAAETAEEEEDNRLADQLPDIDVHDLLMDCQDIVQRLKQQAP